MIHKGFVIIIEFAINPIYPLLLTKQNRDTHERRTEHLFSKMWASGKGQAAENIAGGKDTISVGLLGF